MLVQPLVENAIKYCPLDLPLAEIRVVAELQHNRLLITVENSIKPGTIGNVPDGLRIGHANIRQRLDLLYEKSAKFTFFAAESVVTAQLELPILTTATAS
jgi:LytS/YehU family sensor histidine kinase